MRVLVINSGSSTIKFQLYDMSSEKLLISCTVERIGESDSQFSFHNFSADGAYKQYTENLSIADHKAGLKYIFSYMEHSYSIHWKTSLQAIGHRVVHGGEAYSTSVLIDEKVITEIQKMIPLAPLHNPVNLAGIQVMRELCPEIPQVAVFDTAFFQTLPQHAYRYALPEDLYTKLHIRRYGFHGTSHQYVAKQAAGYLQRPLENLKLITLHLGNGASVAAIHNGVCVDTSMGMTPLEGLIMGTRCGDIDPSIPFYIASTLNMELNKIETLLNHNSGLKGLCGVSDMRDVHCLANEGNKQAKLAIDMYCYRICKYIGAYYISLGGLDALVFTAGIGEHDALIRASICNKLSILGITINHKQNQHGFNESFSIDAEDSKIKVLVIKTNEELEIARQTETIINPGSPH